MLEWVADISNMSFLNHIFAREVTNGMWFIASSFLLASMVRFLSPRILRQPKVWQQPIDVRLAWAIALIAAGTALRAGWIWAFLIASKVGDVDAVETLESLGVISYVAIGFGIWGAVCTVKAVTEAASARRTKSYLWAYWSFVILATVTVPVVVTIF